MVPNPSKALPLPTVIVLILALLAAVVAAQPPGEKPTAAELFEQTLAAEGLEPALAQLAEALSDTTEPYSIDAYELGIGLPARLVIRRQRVEALELVKALQPLFGDHPRYWQELGVAHIRCGNTDEAREALTRARDTNTNRPDLAWMVEHLDELVAIAKLQAEREGRLVPGQSTGLTGPYLGQTPPGEVPRVFAPGILNTTAHEYHISFAPDGREIVFSRGGVGSLVTRWEDDGWTEPEVIHFIDEDHLTEEANLTPDGRAIVFCGRADIHEPRDLYRAERIGDGWGEPIRLFPGMYATSTLDGSLYYTTQGEGNDYGVIVKRTWSGSSYGEPVVVPGEGINTEFPDAHPWIAPNEDLLIFDTYRDPGMGLYASFLQADGTWSPAVFLHDKLSIPPVGQPALSHDEKYLFFCLAGDMYWVDAGFLAELKPGGTGN
ncbi:MAG: hypothetical protein KOO60_11130 [Gemmatimonadales bacterium]|nr:hypothetical protein [Gemmatimonadales bacterium]